MSQPRHTTNLKLEKLSDTNLTLAHTAEDIRGRKVLDASGSDIGHVSALFIDRGERKVRTLEIRAGGFLGLGDRHFLLPEEAITSVVEGECISTRHGTGSCIRLPTIRRSRSRPLRITGARITGITGCHRLSVHNS
jgi:sporulation protein YlmC with PRC-barrel domain